MSRWCRSPPLALQAMGVLISIYVGIKTMMEEINLPWWWP